MNKKILVLLVSAMLLTACKKENQTVNETNTVGNTSVVQQSNEDIAVAQKELLQVFNVKDRSMAEILAYTQTLGQVNDAESQKKVQDKMFELTLKVQKELNNLKISNAEIKDYIDTQNKMVQLSERIYKDQAKIDKEAQSGKLSPETEALLKEIQAIQAQVMQKEFVLTDKLANADVVGPAQELLKIKQVLNKEAIQLAQVMQSLMLDKTLKDEEKEKKAVEATNKINDTTVAELSLLKINTPDIAQYKNKLLELATLKKESLKRTEQIRKELATNKKLSKESQAVMEKLQREGLEVEVLRMQLTDKYSR